LTTTSATRYKRTRQQSKSLRQQVDTPRELTQVLEEVRLTLATPDLGDLEWHTLPTSSITQRLTTSDRDGLSQDQVQRRVAQYGRNAPSPPQTHRIKAVFGYFFKGFGSILLIGAILVFIAWKPLGNPPAQANLALAIVLVAVFLIQAAFNMWQDWSSARVMASIKDMLPAECHVVRDGSQVTLLAVDVVPGDLVLVKAGDKLPADLRFIEVSSDAKFDRSILTGESVPLSATVDSTDSNYLETKCIGLQSTHCVSGTCKGIVVATGNHTVFGRIAKLTNEPKQGLTTLEREVLNFVLLICGLMFTMMIVVIVVWFVLCPAF
jgi:sodium/potassium-transporting ATPase subunit alpha